MRFAWIFLTCCFIAGCSGSIETTPETDPKSIIQSQPAVPFEGQVITLDFRGPETSETATPNPFTDMRLMVRFQQGEQSLSIRGYFAADGDAANTSATSGNIWRAKFSPPLAGVWNWTAQMTGPNGETLPLDKTSGVVSVAEADVVSILRTDRGYFRFPDGDYWLKGGTNSPENLLAYEGFDGTYRMDLQTRTGESNATDKALHHYKPHVKDWRDGDPIWQGDKGKGLIGGMNYLADQGMNAVYFLTLNIDGDGKDIWPYTDPNERFRFDVSKLEQWGIVFDHMQDRGLLLHLVLQETENELLLDGGDTGKERRAYLDELISRFAHHPALIWNLGEENGPVHWRPEGQTDDQRRQMIGYLTQQDPYNHPILLHTHAEAVDKDKIAGPLLGLSDLDGLSFQIADRRTVHAETRRWHEKSSAAGQGWLLSMDEIGHWHTGALPDADDPDHNSLRRHALWGHLLAGGAGVEWYFGAYYEPNDLSAEDWRSRAELWRQTDVALQFFEDNLPFWDMSPCDGIIDRADHYCFGKAGELYAAYLFDGGTATLNLPGEGNWDVYWFDPKAGGDLQRGTVSRLESGNMKQLGKAPVMGARDWVVLLKKDD